MKTVEIEVYELFKYHMGEIQARTIIEYLDLKAEEKINQRKDIFLTKEDKVDMLKWIIGMWVVQMMAIVGLYIRP
jgi:hypothetical protein